MVQGKTIILQSVPINFHSWKLHSILFENMETCCDCDVIDQPVRIHLDESLCIQKKHISYLSDLMDKPCVDIPKNENLIYELINASDFFGMDNITQKLFGYLRQTLFDINKSPIV